MDPRDTRGTTLRPGAFLDSEAGQFIAGAHCYLTAAGVLRKSKLSKTAHSVLVKPTLHVLSHGIELLLKFPLLYGGAPMDEVRKFGHSIGKLWADRRTVVVRGLVATQARAAWSKAAKGGKWPDDDFTSEPIDVLNAAVARLDELHGRETDFALRYLIGPNTTGPRAAFLIDAFGPVATDLLGNPSRLDQ